MKFNWGKGFLQKNTTKLNSGQKSCKNLWCVFVVSCVADLSCGSLIRWQKMAAYRQPLPCLTPREKKGNYGRRGGEEHLSTIEIEEEYVQSLVTGTLHWATKQPEQWPRVWPSPRAGTYMKHSKSCIHNSFNPLDYCTHTEDCANCLTVCKIELKKKSVMLI